MAEFKTGVVQANGLQFHYLEMGKGPLALCLHGFPDSPWSYRYLLPELAKAGYRAVAPFMRGYAPTEVPTDGRYILAPSPLTWSLSTAHWAEIPMLCLSLTIGDQ